LSTVGAVAGEFRAAHLTDVATSGLTAWSAESGLSAPISVEPSPNQLDRSQETANFAGMAGMSAEQS